MDAQTNINLAMVAIAAAGGLSIGGLFGILVTWLHFRRQERLMRRIDAAAGPSIWRDGHP